MTIEFKNPARKQKTIPVQAPYVPEHVRLQAKPEVQTFGQKQDLTEEFKAQAKINNKQPNIGKVDSFTSQFYDEQLSKTPLPEMEDLSDQELKGKKPIMIVEDDPQEIIEDEPGSYLTRALHDPEEINQAVSDETDTIPDWLLPVSVFDPENQYLVLLRLGNICTIYATTKTREEACALIEEECLSGQNGFDVPDFLVFKKFVPVAGVSLKE